MRLIHVVCCVAVAVAAVPLLGCANEDHEASTKAALSQERAAASVQDRARSVLLASEVQLQDLRTSRDEITDMHQRDAIATQIVDLTMSRDRLMGDLAAGGKDTTPIERDISNLQRAMRSTGAAEAQPQSAPRPQSEPVPQTQPPPQ